MQQVKGNMFASSAKVLLIPTNGIVKKNGEAVMGAGVAKTVLDLSTNLDTLKPTVSEYLGKKLKLGSNIPYSLGYLNYWRILKEPSLIWEPRPLTDYETSLHTRYTLYSFPTKHNYRDKSNTDLIRRSSELFKEIWYKIGSPTVALPKVGCGLGGLDWSTQVEPILQEIFPEDQFVVYYQ